MKKQGFVSSHKAPNIFCISDGNGTWIVKFRDTPSEAVRLNGHYCQIVDGTPCTFEILNDRICDVAFGVDPLPAVEHETSEIVSRKDGWGFCERECGCQLYFQTTDIITFGKSTVGTFIWHRVKTANGKVRACEIEIIMPEKVRGNVGFKSPRKLL
jgi:hypothetical protein